MTFSPVEDLRRWRDELGLGCDLLSDADRRVGLAWGAAATADQEKASRISVLIDPAGTVTKVYPSPDPATHAEEILRDL